MQVRRTIRETLYNLVRMFWAGRFGTVGQIIPLRGPWVADP